MFSPVNCGIHQHGEVGADQQGRISLADIQKVDAQGPLEFHRISR